MTASKTTESTIAKIVATITLRQVPAVIGSFGPATLAVVPTIPTTKDGAIVHLAIINVVGAVPMPAIVMLVPALPDSPNLPVTANQATMKRVRQYAQSAQLTAPHALLPPTANPV